MDDATQLLWLSYGPHAIIKQFGAEGALALFGANNAQRVIPAGAVAASGSMVGVSSARFPANPFAVSSSVAGRKITTIAEVEAVFGMPFGAVMAPNGPTYKSVLKETKARGADSKASSATVKPSGAPLAVRRPMSKVELDTSLAVDFNALRGGATPPSIAPEAAEVPRINNLWRLLNTTEEQWFSLTCAEQQERLARAGSSRSRDDQAAINRRFPHAEGWYGEPPLARDRMQWVRVGDYAMSSPLVTDPVQGEIGDCYLIAALAGIAWVRPDIIVAGHYHGRASGRSAAARGTQTITFHQSVVCPPAAMLPPGEYPVTITDMVPVLSGHCEPIFASGATAANSWAAVWEKAMLKLTQGATNDRPAYLNASGDGMPIGIGWSTPGLIMNLAGGGPLLCADPLLFERVIVEHCDPMGKAASVLLASKSTHGIDAATNTFGPHYYSVLGTYQMGGERFVVLRNPWGHLSPGRPGRGGVSWNGLQFGLSGIGALSMSDFVRTFSGIEGNWYGAMRTGDLAQPCPT